MIVVEPKDGSKLIYAIALLSANKLKEGWSKFLDKMKSKKAKKKQMKKMEQELMFRAMSFQDDLTTDYNGSSREGSIYSQQDSDDVRDNTVC